MDSAAGLSAAVAYWTVGPNFVSPNLSARIAPRNGFLCVDLHLPTDIDNLAELKRAGGNVYLFILDVKTVSDHGNDEKRWLLHSKMLLFDKNDGTSELWVGSHNWTRRALMGLNIESTVRLQCMADSPILKGARSYLEGIRSQCEAFDLGKIEFYKQLQRQYIDGSDFTLELEGDEPDQLSKTTVTVFGTDAEEFPAIRGFLGRNIYVQVYDTSSDAYFIYEARLTQAGEMTAYNPAAGEISFPDRRYAHRVGSKAPLLLPQQAVPTHILAKAYYFVTIAIDALDKSAEAFEMPERRSPWIRIPAKETEVIQRLRQQDLDAVFDGRKPTVKAPVANYEAATPYRRSLAERQERHDRRIFSRKLIRRQEEEEQSENE